MDAAEKYHVAGGGERAGAGANGGGLGETAAHHLEEVHVHTERVREDEGPACVRARFKINVRVEAENFPPLCAAQIKKKNSSNS